MIPSLGLLLLLRLKALQVRLETSSLDRLPASARELARYDAVIISDWPSPALEEAQLEALSTFVEKRGGGLVFIGGSNVKTKQWHGSPLEKLLPISFIPQPQ